MRKFLFVFLITLGSQLSAQSKIDSLLSVLKNADHDSIKVLTGIDLTNHYRTSNADSAIYFGERALATARNLSLINYPKFENIALTKLGLAYGYTQDHKRKGISYIRKAIPYYEQQRDLEQLAYNYFCIGYFLNSHLHEYDSAVYYFTKATALSDTLNTRYVSGSYNNGGLAMFRAGDYEGALTYYLKAVEMRKVVGSTYDVACSILNLGMAYDKLGQPEIAKRTYFQALEGFRDAGHVPNEAVSLKDIGDVLTAQDSLAKALVYYDKATALFAQVNSIYLLSDCFLNMSTIYLKLGEYEKALDFLNNAEQNVPNGASERFKGQVYAHLANANFVLADSLHKDNSRLRLETLRKARRHGEQAWFHADSSKSLEVKIMALSHLVRINEELNYPAQALYYSKLLAENTALSNKQTQSEVMAQMSTEYETDRIQSENELLQASQRIQDARLKKQQYLISGVLVVLLLLVVIGWIIFMSRKKLQQANATIQSSLSEKELLLKEIHHRVKNNLQVVSSLLDLQSRGIEDEKALSTFMEGQNRVKAMSLIHEKLYQNDNLATIDFAEYAKELMKELAAIYPSSHLITTQVVSTKGASFDIDTAVPLGLILNELISNAYKYAFKETGIGNLNITLESMGEGKHQLTVIDTGVGLPDTFDFSKAKSLGLRLVRRLAKQLYGSVDYRTDAGAKFVISFTDTLQRRAI